MRMSDADKNHPEMLPDEVFLRNAADYHNPYWGDNRRSSWEAIGWRTKRKGMVAYDIDGKPLDPINCLFPVFVKREELIRAGINPDTLWSK